MRTEETSPLSRLLPTTDDLSTTICPSSWPLNSSGSAQKVNAGTFTHVLQPLLGTTTANKASELINGILPGFVIDARGARLSEFLQFTDSSRLGGVVTLVDTKGLGISHHQTTLPFAPNKDSSSPSTAGQLRRTRSTARPSRTSAASTTVLRMAGLARSNPPSCRSGLWLASTRARFSGSASAVS